MQWVRGGVVHQELEMPLVARSGGVTIKNLMQGLLSRIARYVNGDTPCPVFARRQALQLLQNHRYTHFSVLAPGSLQRFLIAVRAVLPGGCVGCGGDRGSVQCQFISMRQAAFGRSVRHRRGLSK